MQTSQPLTQRTTEAATASAAQPARRPVSASTALPSGLPTVLPTVILAACAAIAASSTTLLLALAPALLAPSGGLAAQGAQLVELPRVVISAHRESVVDGTRVDAGRVQELPRVWIAGRHEPDGARAAAGEGAGPAGQPVMQRRGF